MLSRFSVKRPMTVVVVILLIIILGIVSYTSMSVDMLPEMEMPYVILNTAYTGASPEEVEMYVTRPLEASLSLLSGLKSINSVSADNVSTITLEFAQGTDMDGTMVDISSAADMAAAAFPQGVSAPVFLRINPSMLPVMILTADKENSDRAAFSTYVEEDLIPELSRADGVAEVTAIGLVSRQVQLTWNDQAIENYNDRILAYVDSELASAKKKLDDSREELEEARLKLDEEEAKLYEELARAQIELDQGRLELEMGKNQLEAMPDQLIAQLAELEATEAQLEGMLQLLEGIEQMEAGIAGLETTVDDLNAAEDNISALYGSVPAARREVAAQKGVLDTAYNNYNSALSGGDTAAITAAAGEFGLAAAEAGALLSQLSTALGQGGGTGDNGQGGAGDMQDPAVVYAALSAGLIGTDEGLAQVHSGLREAEAALAELKTQYMMLNSSTGGMDEDDVNDSLEQVRDGIDQIEDALDEIPEAQAELEEAREKLNEGALELETGKLTANTELSSAGVQIAMGEAQLEAAYEEFEAARDEAFRNAGMEGALTPESLAAILGAEHFSMPAGYMDNDGVEVLLKVGDKFMDVQELSDLILADIDINGIGEIKVSDVTTLEVVDDGGDTYAIVNGNPGIILMVQKQSMAGTADVSHEINDLLAALMAANSDLHLTPLYDGGFYIDTALSAVITNLLLGAILAIFILLLFLRDIKPTLIVGVSIPISLLFSLTLMYFSGVNINIISLAGLAMGVGMLVDNSIVVIENIYRMRSAGADTKTAAVEGAKQVAGAITASTLTTVCVFVPVLFTEGMTRELFTDMGLTVAYSLLASLLVALTVIPAAGSRMLSQPRAPGRFYGKMLDKYSRLLEKNLRHKWVAIVGALAVMVFCGIGVISAGTGFIPAVDYGQLAVTLEGKDEKVTDEELRAMSDEAIAQILTLDYVDMAAAYDAAAFGGGMMGGEGISMYVLLDIDAGISTTQAAAEIRELTAHIDGEITIENSGADMSMLIGSGASVKISGDNMDDLMSSAREIADIIGEIEGFEQISTGMEEAKTEIRVSVDKNKAMSYGLTVAQIYSELAAKTASETKSITLDTRDGSYPVVINPDPDSLLTPEKLTNHKFVVEVSDGMGGSEEKTVYLSDIATVKVKDAMAAIHRDGQTRYMTVTARAADGYNMGIISRDLEAALSKYTPPVGVSISIGGENEAINDMLADTLLMILMACAFIYLIMVAQFQSLALPFIILLTTPLAFSGGLLALILLGQEVTLVAMLGFLLLAGIIVNNGIVFIDRINQLREEGMEIRQALIATGQQRMRPILMTALTTVFSLLAMIFSTQMGAEMLRPMALVAAAGLVYATVLTLFIVPSLYEILELRRAKRRQRRTIKNIAS